MSPSRRPPPSRSAGARPGKPTGTDLRPGPRPVSSYEAAAEKARKAEQAPTPAEEGHGHGGLFLLPALVLALAVGYALLWYVLATQSRQGFLDWAEAQRGAGWTIESGELRLTGFPLRVGIEAEAVRVVAPADHGGWSWTSESLLGQARLWSPRPLILTASGPQGLTIPAENGPPLALDGVAEILEARISTVSSGHLQSAAVTLAALTLRPAGQRPSAATADLALTLERLDAAWQSFETVAPASSSVFSARTSTPTPAEASPVSQSATLTLRGLLLPRWLAGPLGRQVRAIEVEAHLLGRIPSDRPLYDGLMVWRDDEAGRLEIPRLFIDWDPVAIGATGSLGLDDRLQPTATLNAQIQGFFQAVDQMEASGMVQSSHATLARVVLQAMSRRSASGASVLSLPVVVQTQTLSVGPVPLVVLPDIYWSGRPPRRAGKSAQENGLAGRSTRIEPEW